jgi:hypothetical protein
MALILSPLSEYQKIGFNPITKSRFRIPPEMSVKRSIAGRHVQAAAGLFDSAHFVFPCFRACLC